MTGPTKRQRCMLQTAHEQPLCMNPKDTRSLSKKFQMLTTPYTCKIFYTKRMGQNLILQSPYKELPILITNEVSEKPQCQLIQRGPGILIGRHKEERTVGGAGE